MLFQKVYKHILLVVVLAFISMTIWTVEMKFFQFEKLEGSFKKIEKIDLTSANWFSGEFQKTFEEYIIFNNQLSPFFIKTRNQIYYSIFDELPVSRAVFGKDGMLYQVSYIKSYYGADYVGEDKLREYVEKLQFIQDTLQKLNKEFIYIQAPGKASFYPEYIPEDLKGPLVTTNYDVVAKLLKEYNIKHIDFRPYFIENKTKSKYPLYSRTGAHWSKYAMALVMDSLTTFIEKEKSIDMPNMYWNEVEMHTSQYEDRDIEGFFNLLFPMNSEKYAYPVLKVESFEGKTAPKVFMVGDSYLGNLYWGLYFESLDTISQFWYYNNSVFSKSFFDKMHRYQLDQITSINNSEVVILGCTEVNISGLGWDFVDKMYGYYKYGKRYTDKELAFLSRVDSTRSYIETRGLLKKEIKTFSEKQKISLDSALTVGALWYLMPSL